MLELVGYLKSMTNFDRPSPRFVLYGEHGVGKSMALVYALQYAHENNYLLVHIPWGKLEKNLCSVNLKFCIIKSQVVPSKGTGGLLSQ